MLLHYVNPCVAEFLYRFFIYLLVELLMHFPVSNDEKLELFYEQGIF